ncbi:MAG: dockerin type I domain-containing protein, partial [Eubacteriales bacterium]|nr:dockerin type I domain-containing protein [Eubacteriales bacterium]
EIARIDAENYKTAHGAALALTVGTVRVADETLVNAALSAYDALTAEAKAKLTAEKTLLDSLVVQIEDLKAQAEADAFRTTHGAILAETVDTVVKTDRAAVDAALNGYALLSTAAQAKASSEKTLLDALLLKIYSFGFDVAGSIALQGRSSGKLDNVTIKLTPASGDPISVVTDLTGAYTLNAILMGTYTLTVEKPGYLSYRKNTVVVGDDMSLASVSLKGGDINGDGQVTSTDLSTLLSLYLNSTTATSDINGDGQITSTDLSILLSNYLVSRTIVD